VPAPDTTAPDPRDAFDPDAPFDPGTAPLRRLTHAEYDRSVQALLGVSSTPSSTFPPEDRVRGYTNQAEAQSASPLLIERYSNAAATLAAAARIDPLLPCTPSGTADRACMEDFVRAFLLHAYRRPPTTEEIDDLAGVALAEATDAGTFADGARIVIEIALQAPSFLYREETGAPSAERPGFVALDDYSIASRLSYLLWGTMPDDALFDAAAREELHTSAELRAQAERMLEDDRARDALRTFFAEWVGYRDVLSVAKNDTLYPSFDSTLAQSMAGETERFLDDLVWTSDRDFFDVLVARDTFVDARLGQLYELGSAAPTGSSFARVTLPAERVGLLAQGSFLAARARPNSSSPTQRGLFVRTHLLCEEIMPPPPGINFSQVEPAEGRPATTRERLEEFHKRPECNTCHAQMDPIGFGLEHFDAIGAWRDTEGGVAIEATGWIREDDPATRFDGLPELASMLHDDPQVERCVLMQLDRWWRGRGEETADEATLGAAQRELDAGGRRFKALLIAIAASDATRFKRP